MSAWWDEIVRQHEAAPQPGPEPTGTYHELDAEQEAMLAAGIAEDTARREHQWAEPEAGQ